MFDCDLERFRHRSAALLCNPGRAGQAGHPGRQAMTADTHCADCGRLLDAFGTCPQADPREAARMSKPVNCGNRPLGGDYTRTDAEKGETR